MHITDPPAPGAAPVLDRAVIRRFVATLRAIDPCATPSGPLAGSLHLAVAALADAEPDRLSAAERVDLLSGLYGALAALDEARLEMPDLSVIPTGELAAWFRQLYCCIMRLRVAALRLHRAWTGTVPVDRERVAAGR